MAEVIEAYRSEPQGGIPGRDFAKWLNEQPEKSEEEIDARIMAIQDAMDRGEIDFAGLPIK